MAFERIGGQPDAVGVWKILSVVSLFTCPLGKFLFSTSDEQAPGNLNSREKKDKHTNPCEEWSEGSQHSALAASNNVWTCRVTETHPNGATLELRPEGSQPEGTAQAKALSWT